MYSKNWWEKTSVVDDLYAKPQAFEFIQSIRLLRHSPSTLTQKKWADDFLFESSFNLKFPLSEIEALNFDGKKTSITNLIVGITGVQGALPYSYVDKVRQTQRKQRVEVQQFINMFNHKLVAQYADSSIAYNLPIRYEVDQGNHYLKILHALNGYVAEHYKQESIDDYFAEFSGLMQGQNNNTYALKTVLNCIFAKKIEVNEFVAEKFILEAQQRANLDGQKGSLLGINAFCGETVRQVNGKIELKIGPLSRIEYLDFLPSGKQSRKLKQILKSWCDPTLLVDIRLVLDGADVKPYYLSSRSEVGLAQGAFLLPRQQVSNDETCYCLIG